MTVRINLKYNGKSIKTFFETNVLKGDSYSAGEVILLARQWLNKVVRKFNPMFVGDLVIEVMNSNKVAVVETKGMNLPSPDYVVALARESA